MLFLGELLTATAMGHFERGIALVLALFLALSPIGDAFVALAGSLLPFLLRLLRFGPTSASAPSVATLADVAGPIRYFSAASIVLRGAILWQVAGSGQRDGYRAAHVARPRSWCIDLGQRRLQRATVMLGATARKHRAISMHDIPTTRGV